VIVGGGDYGVHLLEGHAEGMVVWPLVIMVAPDAGFIMLPLRWVLNLCCPVNAATKIYSDTTKRSPCMNGTFPK
jgi:hypothetical protein